MRKSRKKNRKIQRCKSASSLSSRGSRVKKIPSSNGSLVIILNFEAKIQRIGCVSISSKCSIKQIIRQNLISFSSCINYFISQHLNIFFHEVLFIFRIQYCNLLLAMQAEFDLMWPIRFRFLLAPQWIIFGFSS